MPRKAAASTEIVDAGAAEPRRSSRIKDQPKAEVEAPVKKAPAKPKTKKAEKEGGAEGDVAEKPKSTKGRKRKADELNGDEGEAEKPASKKVRRRFSPQAS